MRKAWDKMWELEEATTGRVLTLANIRKNAARLALVVVVCEVMDRRSAARARRIDQEHMAAALAVRQQATIEQQIPEQPADIATETLPIDNAGVIHDQQETIAR